MCEHKHVSIIKLFLEYFVDTWHKILHDVEEYFAMCPMIKNKNGWKTKMDERIKWMKKKMNKRMNKTCAQPKVMC